MKRNEVKDKLKKAAKNAGLEYQEYELTKHTGIKVGSKASTLKRHSEIDNLTAHKFWDQFEEVLGKGWWR